MTENFRLRVGAEKIRQAEAEVISESTIPNPTLFTDYQLIPLQAANRLQAEADRAYALAEVETILGQYDDAVEDITENNDSATLSSTLNLRDRANADYAAGRIRLVELLDAQAAYRQ